MDRPPIRVSLIVLILIIFLVASLWFTGEEKSSMEINLERMALLQEKVTEFHQANGSAPESLADLKLTGDDAENLKDPWDFPYSFEVDGNEVTIGSLGSDGKKGGALFKGDVFKKFSLEEATQQ
ncbi:MAG: type II secretion system protein GspG [Verrucomicrobiota bacterium]